MYIGDIVEDVRKVTACKLILNVCGDNDVDSPRGILWEARVILSKMINHYQDDLTKIVTDERDFLCIHMHHECLHHEHSNCQCNEAPGECPDYEEEDRKCQNTLR